GYISRPPQVESRAAAHSLVRHLLRLHLTGNLGSAVVGRLFALAPAALAVQIALQCAPPVFIGCVADVALQLPLVLALAHSVRRDRRVRVIPECSESAAVELELNEVFLHHQARDGRTVTAADGRARLL